jgi:hypothetical protein
MLNHVYEQLLVEYVDRGSTSRVVLVASGTKLALLGTRGRPLKRSPHPVFWASNRLADTEICLKGRGGGAYAVLSS